MYSQFTEITGKGRGSNINAPHSLLRFTGKGRGSNINAPHSLLRFTGLRKKRSNIN